MVTMVVVVDQEWDDKVWKDAWAVSETVVDEERVKQSNKIKRKGVQSSSGKSGTTGE